MKRYSSCFAFQRLPSPKYSIIFLPFLSFFVNSLSFWKRGDIRFLLVLQLLRNDTMLSERSEPQLATHDMTQSLCCTFMLAPLDNPFGHVLFVFDFCFWGLFLEYHHTQQSFSEPHSVHIEIVKLVLSTHQKHSSSLLRGSLSVAFFFLFILGIPIPQLTLPNKAVSPVGRPSPGEQRHWLFQYGFFLPSDRNMKRFSLIFIMNMELGLWG